MRTTLPLLLGLILSFMRVPSGYGQTFEDQVNDMMSDDLDIGGDIFSNFNDDPDSEQVMKDEKFYRYGRFYALNIGLGVTTFTGNRGSAYSDNHPTYNLGFTHFFDFQNAVTMGFQYSRHTMVLDTVTQITRGTGDDVGRVDVAFFRPYIGYRFYFDTSDLGREITYANPYFAFRFEYWYQTLKYVENTSIDDQKGGGLGASIGIGIELPIEPKESYWGVEFSIHQFSSFDQDTTDFRRVPDDPDSNYGYEDLNGLGVSFMVNYVISW